ncbi:MAG: C4-type zinc ribbon domain-containing protein [Akkermansiaceae bacterium]|jgi:predicted  nucleic acid-binding Zn-ribbon protein|nr:C4-type zinc ribbon domain-containing protein [Akkermansiaceae bacterium]MCU0777633.1 C4-type zinc ribbon domain-containing protein [Akkermansiaceae bacterium]
MLDEVRALLILQDRDRRLLALAKDLERLPQDEARAKNKLAGDEAAVKKAHDALVDCELRLKRLELDAGTRRTTIQRLKVQQYETRKNEEYQALGHEITRYEKEADDLETRELELMEEMDGLRAAQKAAEAALAHTRTLVDEDLATIVRRRERMEAERAELVTERDQLAAGVSESVLPLYQRLMKTKDGMAIAPMHEGKCGGCHMKLIASTVVAVQNAKEMTRCEDCGRILYAEE